MVQSERTADVVVVGAGMTGLFAAREIARRGLSVAVFDRWPLGHTHGSSHGEARIFRLAYASPLYVHLAATALSMWQELENGLGRELLWRTGALDIGPADALEPLRAALAAQGVSYQALSAAQMSDRYPVYRLSQGEHALYQPDGGVLRARRALDAVLASAKENGASVFEATEVLQILPGNTGVVVQTSAGPWRADTVVIAAAGWTNHLIDPLGLHVPMKVTREHVTHFACPQSILPFIWHIEGAPFEFYGLPNGNPGIVKIGEHGAGPEIDPNDDDALDVARFASVDTFRASRLPGVVSFDTTNETCLYAATPDDDFVLDRVDSVVLSLGFGGHGFKFAPLVGSIVADLAQGIAAPASLGAFALKRFSS